ncbi:YggS family pyridoxal phosphate-dependent enzyme [Opitutales bacterium ASA1]|uniref:YggS family pyridoxal phosphate-dependent enzyme n=1 Tax=Congregicoccus parvus TaxID=3081749 RepID=UPI002B2BA6DF|nr:YggS family pyridoxal phosphate-dependent enzyme [Opitutales bacterium ASA1]
MFLTFEEFQTNLVHVQKRIWEACRVAGRDPDSVGLLPVTKTHPPEAAEYVARAGLPAVGENRVQEARDKQAAAGCTGLRWELIGHLQSNKAKLAAAVFQRVQSVDGAKLLGVLARAAEERGAVLPILVQVNAGADPAKFGCELQEASGLIESALRAPSLRLDGLMTIAPLSDDPAVAERTFANLRELRDRMATQFGVPLTELSMGMSGDLDAAIRAGSTQVRVGTALFGRR